MTRPRLETRSSSRYPRATRKSTDSVIDLTHKFNVTRNGTGSGTGQGITAGDYSGGFRLDDVWGAQLRHSAFSSALINGYPFGSAGTGLQADDLSTSSTGPLQIKTTYSASNKEAFATVFRHS